MSAFAHLRQGLTIARPSQRGATGPANIEIAEGTGYAGSRYRATDAGLATEWFADGQMIATGQDYVLQVEHEGKAIRAGSALGPTSNTIEMWVESDTTSAQWLDTFDARIGITLVDGLVSRWAGKAGRFLIGQDTVASRPQFSGTARNNRPGVLNPDDTVQRLLLGTSDLIPVGTDAIIGLDAAAHYYSSNQYQPMLSIGETASRREVGVTNSPVLNVFSPQAGDLSRPIARNTDLLLSALWQIGAGRVNKSTVNGDAPLTRASGTGNFTGQQLFVMGRIGSERRFPGVIQSLSYWSGDRSIEDTQRAQGRLAHIWGMAGLLPADHPYKTAGPRIQ